VCFKKVDNTRITVLRRVLVTIVIIVRNVELNAIVRNFQMLTAAQKLLLWQIYVAGNTALTSHEKCRMFLSILTKSLVFSTDVIDAINIKFYGHVSSGNRTDTCGQTDVVELVGVFGDNGHAPKNVTFNIEVCSLDLTQFCLNTYLTS
jgi:hypothetical protein